MSSESSAELHGRSSGMEKEFELKWRIGFRTAVYITHVASEFASEIEMTHAELKANVKSMMGLMLLNTKAGSRVRLSISGPDADAAMSRLAELFTCGSRQDRCPHRDCSSTPILLDHTDTYISYGCSNWHFWDFTGKSKTIIRLGLKAQQLPAVAVCVN